MPPDILAPVSVLLFVMSCALGQFCAYTADRLSPNGAPFFSLWLGVASFATGCLAVGCAGKALFG